MTVQAIGAVTGMDVSQLAEVYRQQVMAGGAADDTNAAAAAAAAGTSPAAKAAAVRSSDFASMIGQGLQQVENLDLTASTKAIQAASGDLTDVQDYVIAANEAQTATELTTTIRNKALDSFNEIMRMPL